MKKIYKILFTLILVLVIKVKVAALTYGGCDYTTVANLKALVNNVNISYTYKIKNNKAYFDITLNNIPKNVYFLDTNTRKKYYYSDTKNGEITISEYNNVQNGTYKFYIYNNVCNDIKLGTKYYNFPIYNTRYKNELCKDIPNYALCKKWISKYYSDYDFEKKITEYKRSLNDSDEIIKIELEKDLLTKIVEFYIKYYYYFLPVVILVGLLIMYISKKKNSFKL